MSTRRFSLIVAAFVVIAASGCTKSGPAAEPQPPVVVVEPSPTAAPAAASASAPVAAPSPGWEGEWTSPSCGKRQYERRLTIAAGHTFRAEDRVSPCPPNVQCIWSGIVVRAGDWTSRGLTLSLHQGVAMKGGEPLPAELIWEPERAAPVEIADGERCLYSARR